MPAKRVSLVLVLAIGAVLAVFPFATGLFSKTHGVEQLTGDLRTTFTDESLHQTRADLDGVVAMATELQTKTLPALPGALGISDKQFQSLLAKDYPDVATGVAQLPTILPRFDKLVSGLEAEQADFQKADSIPTGFLPSTVLPWILLVVGLLLAGLAVRGLATGAEGTPARQALVGSFVVGLVLVVGSLGFSIHSKGAAVDAVTTNLRPFFTQAGADKSQADLDTVQAMADQLTTKTLPGLAKALHMSDAQFNAFLKKSFPDVATGLAQLPAVLPRFQADVDTISANVGTFHQTADIPVAALPATSVFWWLFLPGLALIAIPLAPGRASGSRGRREAPSGSDRQPSAPTSLEQTLR